MTLLKITIIIIITIIIMRHLSLITNVVYRISCLVIPLKRNFYKFGFLQGISGADTGKK